MITRLLISAEEIDYLIYLSVKIEQSKQMEWLKVKINVMNRGIEMELDVDVRNGKLKIKQTQAKLS